MSDLTSKATVELQINGQQAQQTLSQLRQNALQLESAIAKAAATGNKADLKRLRKELAETKRQIREMESATQQVDQVLRNLDRATPRELNKSLQTLTRQLEYIERGSDAWKAHVEKIKLVKNELKMMNAQLRDGERFWERFNRRMNEWQTSLMAGIAALSGFIMAGRNAVKAFAEMEEELANTRKYTGMAEEGVTQLNESFKKMDTRTSREQLNELAQEAGRLGKNTLEDVQGYVEAADIINVALVDLGEGATQTIAKLTDIFGVSQLMGTRDAMLAVGSTVNVLSQNCTASKPYLVQFAQRMAGVGAQADLTIPQLLAFGATLDANGQKVEMSASALGKLTMTLFQKPTEIAKQVGLEVDKFNETLKRSTYEGLMMFLQRIHDLGAAEGLAVLAPMFKDLGMDGVRMSQVLSTLADHLDMVKWETEEANKAFREATSATNEYQIFNNTVQADLDKARKRIKELAIELGEKLLPVMRHIYTSTSILLRVLSAITTFFIKYRVEIISATAAVTIYSVAVNLATLRTKAVSAATAVWHGILKAGNVLLPLYNILVLATSVAYNKLTGNVTRAAAATRLLNAAIKANPFGLLATALVAAVAGIAAWQHRVRSAREEQERLKREAKLAAAEIKDVEARIGEEASAVNRLKEAIESENSGTRRRNALIHEFNNKFGGYLTNLLTEKATAQDIANAYAEVVKNLRSKMLLEAKEKDMKDNVSVRYGWEASKLADFDAAAKSSGSVMNGEWLKAVTEEQYKKGNRDAKSLQSAVFKNGYAQMMLKDGYGSKNYDQEGNTLMQEKMNEYIKQYVSTRYHEQKVNRKWQPYQKEIDAGIESSLDLTSDTDYTPTETDSKSGKTDRFEKENEWKEKEQALNRISYATGQKDYLEYTKRMLEIEVDYNKQKLEHTDLTENERLSIEADYYEAIKKQTERNNKTTIEEEEASYNERMAQQKQRYIDGQMSYTVYEEAIEQIEIEHLETMAGLYEKGSKEQLQAQKLLQDKLLANQRKHQKQTEEAEKKHQDALAKMKEKYFGDNPAERQAKYAQDLELLKEVYNKEVLAAGNNAKEKLRIEKAFQKARIALMEQYNIEGEERNKNFLQQWNDDMMNFLQSDVGQAVSGTLDTFVSGMSAIFQQMTAIVQAELEIQTAAVEKKYDREISLAEGNNYKVKKLEKQKQQEIAKLKNEANRKMFAMQVIQAVAQTAISAINAYSSAAQVPMIGYILAPIAAAMAVAAGALQIATIKKQQQASEAQGYMEGGFTKEGKLDEVAGIVHAGEWVASQKLVKNPEVRPMLEALDLMQRTNGNMDFVKGAASPLQVAFNQAQQSNTIGSLKSEDVSKTITAPRVLADNIISKRNIPQPVIVQNIPQQQVSDDSLADTIRLLRDRLDEPFLTVNSVTGDLGMKQAQDEYDKLIRNKTPKSRRS